MHPIFEVIELILDPEPHPAALNMAVDETLLQGLAVPRMRVYRWLRPSVSFGYFEKYEAVRSGHPGLDPVRRWTGGGVVPHGADLTYSLLVPAGHPFFKCPVAESYRVIHEALAAAIHEVGIAVSMAPDAVEKISQACFENPARHDLLAGGQKIAGAAQRRAKLGLLHQGSVQNVALPEGFSARLAAGFAARVNERMISAADLDAARALAEVKYATEAWLRKF